MLNISHFKYWCIKGCGKRVEYENSIRDKGFYCKVCGQFHGKYKKDMKLLISNMQYLSSLRDGGDADGMRLLW